MKFLKIEIATLFAFIICIALSTYNLDQNCSEIRKNVLRLHVIAASDTLRDQQVKLQLRDELLKKGSEVFSGSKSKTEAQAKIISSLPQLQQAANSFLKNNGYPFTATVSLEKSWFPTKKYDTFTLPAGYYDALKVIIGKGEGQNWWCVMFPALCLPAAKEGKNDFYGILTEKQQQIITDEKYEVRLWLLEKWQNLSKNFIYNN